MGDVPVRKNPPEICPQCGAEVPRKARSCPECGSDYETGWSEDAAAQRLDLPDDSFDYEEFVKEEFGDAKKPLRPRGIGPLWWIVAAILTILLLLLFLGQL